MTDNARDVVMVGASAGGVQALMDLVGKLPAEPPVAVAVVIHRSPLYETHVAELLGRRTALPVIEPVDESPFEHGCIYIAPRDHHMRLEGSRLRLDHGPKQHRTRPAIDPLFWSAAFAYGDRVVGVLLSGVGEDGVSGLITIKSMGGISIVQDPNEAKFPTMPRNAIVSGDVDYVLPLDGIGASLTRLAEGEPGGVPGRERARRA